MRVTTSLKAVVLLSAGLLTACGDDDSSRNNKETPSKPDPAVNLATELEKKETDRWNEMAEELGNVTLEPPADFDPNTHLTMEFFRWKTPPKSVGDFPHAERKMTEEEGRRLFFDGLLPLIFNANKPDPINSEFGIAISEGMIVGPACATTNSQVLEYASRKAGLEWLAPLFDDPWGYLPTHNNEYQFMLLGWHYFLMDEYVSPTGSVGAWTRYTFYGIPDHTGHIYMTFEDLGPDTSPLVGDNTRQSHEPHGHLYRPKGRPVGFWLPPGVYPVNR